MNPARAIEIIRKVSKKPPHVIARRVLLEMNAVRDRYYAPVLEKKLNGSKLCALLGAADINALWEKLGSRPHIFAVGQDRLKTLADIEPDHVIWIRNAASKARKKEVSLLGSGDVTLSTIDWQCDFKTGVRWPNQFMKKINYYDPHSPSDVKVPWELSRLQWAFPAGQEYMLTGDEKNAEFVRDLISDWIDNNPYSFSVNWSCTMEAALRIFSWIWFFYAFRNSRAWSDVGFREKFLTSLYLHGVFTEKYLEYSDVNGNHMTADSAAMTVSGCFWGAGPDADRWSKTGWKLLETEITKQVYADGADFEASSAYHRFVAEMFLVPAMFRKACGHSISDVYKSRLAAMARFIAGYSAPNGHSPLWGDADDGRVYAFGSQAMQDHRYLIALIGDFLGDQSLLNQFSGDSSELYWYLGTDGVRKLTASVATKPVTSAGFPESGIYVLREGKNHIFVDCAELGLANRGGHGHNDCLSFEAHLDGEPLIADCGSYVYTASFEERNNFRSTAYHNTPQVDGVEINRFIDKNNLWRFHYEAVPEVLLWKDGPDAVVFMGAHAGYKKLADPVVPVRTIALSKGQDVFCVRDVIKGKVPHDFRIPFHFYPGAEIVSRPEERKFVIKRNGKEFIMVWESTQKIGAAVLPARISPSYGVWEPASQVVFTAEKSSELDLAVSFAAASADVACLIPIVKSEQLS